MEHIAIGVREPELLSSLAVDLSDWRNVSNEMSAPKSKNSPAGKTSSTIARDLLDAIDPDKIEALGGTRSRESGAFVQQAVAPNRYQS